MGKLKFNKDTTSEVLTFDFDNASIFSLTKNLNELDADSNNMYCEATNCFNCIEVQCNDVKCNNVNCNQVKCTSVKCNNVHCTSVHCTNVQCNQVQCNQVHCNNCSYDTRCDCIDCKD